MKKSPRSFWILLTMLVASLALVACVRPYPGGDQVLEQTVTEPVATVPGFVPVPELPTPIGGVATLEPVPVEPTVETVVPTAEPVQTDTIHTVQAGDTLFKIALQYDVTIDEITAVNDIPDINRLEIGQQIVIPVPGSTSSADTSDSASAADTGDSTAPSALPEELPTTAAPAQGGGTHIVQAGENLFRIGLQYGCTVNQMAAANGIANPTYIYVGQALTVPDCN